MSATDDAAVARLAELLREAADKRAMPGVFGTFSTRMLAEELLKRGVTLPPAPVVTPLEAAARARMDGVRPGAWDSLSEESKRGAMEAQRRDITAAVGALSDDDVEVVVFDDVLDSGGVRKPAALRAALLARLTEGGN
ncbi:MAG: hypothetical protein IPK12_23655 [Gemmatimonadetes bacterium]|nr:hypothetical protein [Gemmatimonadota bacterium]